MEDTDYCFRAPGTKYPGAQFSAFKPHNSPFQPNAK